MKLHLKELFSACRENNLEELKRIHSFDKRVLHLREPSSGKSLLHEASQFNSLQCVDWLLRQGLDVDVLKRGDWSPLMLACAKGHVDMVMLLMSHHANLSLCNKDGWNALHIAVRQGNEEIVKLLLQKDVSIVWKTTKLNRNVLHLASLHANFPMFKILLHYLSNNKMDDRSSNNSNNKKDERMMMMMRDVVGSDVVSECVRSDCLPILQRTICMLGTSCLRADLLHIAAETASMQCLNFICGDNSRTRITDEEIVVTWSNKNQLLNDRTTSFQLFNHLSQSPLHLAAKEGHTKVVKFLLHLGLSPSVFDVHHRTAKDLAILAKHQDCAQLLSS